MWVQIKGGACSHGVLDWYSGRLGCVFIGHLCAKEFFGPLGQGGATGKHDTSEYKGPVPAPYRQGRATSEVGLLKEEPFAHVEAQELLWSTSEKA